MVKAPDLASLFKEDNVKMMLVEGVVIWGSMKYVVKKEIGFMDTAKVVGILNVSEELWKVNR